MKFDWLALLNAFLNKSNPFVVKALLKELAKSFVTSILGWSGPAGWITTIALRHALKWGWTTIEALKIKWQVKKESKEHLDKYVGVINKPGVTADEIKQAANDFLTRN